MDAWLACLCLIVSGDIFENYSIELKTSELPTVPAFLHVIFHLLLFFNLREETRWTFSWGVFVYFGIYAQQVCSYAARKNEITKTFNYRALKVHQSFCQQELCLPYFCSVESFCSKTLQPPTLHTFLL